MQMFKRLVGGLFSSMLVASALAGTVSEFTGTLVANENGPDLTAGLSSPGGSNNVTFTKPGSFEHLFKFSFNGKGWLNGQVLHVARKDLKATQGVTFDDIYFLAADKSPIDDLDFSLRVRERADAQTGLTTVTTKATTGLLEVTGDFYLYVSGWAGDETSGTFDTSYSYSGHINLTPQTQVPEPASLALVLAALGGAVWARRRNSSRTV